MKYYKLIYDYINDEDFIYCCSVEADKIIDEYIMSKGILIENWSNAVFKYEPKYAYILSDYIANVYRWLIVSKKFCMLTQAIFGKQVQYLPIEITDINNTVTNDSFQILNVLDILDALDLEHSKYDIFELDDEKIISVEKYALKSSVMKGHPIFRLKDDTIPVFVSEEVKTIVEKNHLTGFRFLEVDVC